MVRLFFYIWPFATMKISPIMSHKFAKVGSAFCQIRNKLSKNCQILVNLCQNGKILPNLVTLLKTPVLYKIRPGISYLHGALKWEEVEPNWLTNLDIVLQELSLLF